MLTYNQNYSTAIDVLNNGGRVKRSTWSDSVWVNLSISSGKNYFTISTNKINTSWTPHDSDITATDWIVDDECNRTE